MAVVCRLKRVLTQFSLRNTLRISHLNTEINGKNYFQHVQSPQLVQCRNSRYSASPFIERIKEQYEYDILKKPEEWKYVESLLPYNEIPKIEPKSEYPSGWIPPKPEAAELPYFLARTKNHMLPIYLRISHRGTKRISRIRKIEGDIWLLNDEIRKYLQEKNKRVIPTQVNEFTKTIDVKGDYVIDLNNWAYSKGF